MPDGRVGRFEVPDGTSPEQAQELINSYVASKPELAPKEEPSDDSSDLVRGFTNYGPQLKETYGAAKVLAGKAVGSDALMKSGLETMEEAKQSLRAKSKSTDSFSEALDKGMGAVLTDWLPYQVGSGAANLLESLAVMGAGAAAGSVVPGYGTAVGGALGLVEKELVKTGVKKLAKEILEKEGEEIAKKFVEEKTAAAAKKVARDVAATSALAAQAGFHGAGETTSRAVEEAQRLGKEATDIELGRVVPSAIVHGVAEFVGDKIGLGAWAKIDLNQKNLLLNFAKNLVTTGTKEAPVEAIQSAAERYGASLSLTDAEAIKEYVDSAAAAYAMSIVPAAGGAVKTRGMAGIDEKSQQLQEQFRQDAQQQMESGVTDEQKAEVEAQKISTTAVPDAQGNVQSVKFEPVPDATATTPVESGLQKAATMVANEEQKAEVTVAKGKEEVAQLVGDAYAEHGSGKKVLDALKPQLEAMGITDAKEQKATIEEARQSLNIPTGNTKEGRAAKKVWQQQWKDNKNAQQSTQTVGGRSESGATSPVSTVGESTGEATTSDVHGVDLTGGASSTTDNTAAEQRPTLAEEEARLAKEAELAHEALTAELIRRDEAAAKPKLAEDQVKTHYDTMASEVAKAHNMQLPAWEELSDAEKEAITSEAEDAQLTKGMTPSKGKVAFMSPAMAAIYKSRVDKKIEDGEIDLTKAPQEVIDLYEEERGDWSDENEVRTTSWNELSTDEKSIYLDNIKRNTIEERNNAFDILAEYREAKLKNIAPRGASFYETNREAYNKELPKWSDLDSADREAFLKAIEPGLGAKTTKPKVTTAQMDAGFNAVAESVNKRLKEKAAVETKQAEEEKGRAQRVAKEEEAAAKEEVEVGKELPTLVKMMLGQGGINNVLTYIAKKASGIMIGKKDSPRSEAIRNYEKRYGALSRAIFKNVAMVLNTINFSNSKVVVDPNNKVIQQLEREGKLAAYDPKTDTFYFTKNGMDEMTVLHEIVHAGTIKILYAFKTNPSSLTPEQRAAAEQINKIYEFTKGRLEKKYPNQLENVYEFISYALTDPRFQEELSRIQAPSLAKYTLAPNPSTPGLQSIWSHLTKVMMKLFGLTKAAARFFEIKSDLYDDVAKAFGGEKYTKQKLTIDKNVQQEIKNYIAKDGDVDTGTTLTFESVNTLRDDVQSRLESKYPEAFSNTSDQGVADFVEKYLGDKTFAEEVDKTAADTYKQGKIGLTKQAGFQGNALLEVTQAFQNILAAPEAGIDIEALPAKKAGPLQDRTFEEMRAEQKTGKPTAAPKRLYNAMLSGKLGHWAETKFVNDRAPLKRWQEKLSYAGRVIAYGVGMNNIYDQIVLSSGNAHWMYTQYVQALNENIRQGVAEYAKKKGLSIEVALQELSLYAVYRHMQERRETLYMKKVKLSDAPIIKYTDAKGNISNISPAAMREEIFKLLNTNEKLTDAEIASLDKALRNIVFDKNNTYLHPDVIGKDASNIESTSFDVAGTYTAQNLAVLKKQYDKDAADAAPIFKTIKQLNNTILKLNKMSNRMSKFAENWIKFYGWENYVPLKGKNVSEEAELLNLDSRRLGGELQDAVYTFQGNHQIPDNPILQVMADGALAAMHVSLNNVTESIYNSSKANKEKNPNGSGVLPTAEVDQIINFEQRQDNKFVQSLGGETKVFHYMPDGKVAVISIKDKALLESIRRSYREINPTVDFLNKATGFFGQLHTRFNIAFAPVNFVRDVLTNAFTMGAELGPKAAFDYIASVAKGVVTGGLYKTLKFNRLYANGNIAEIERLAAADKSGYYQAMMDYVKTGGRVSYLAGIANKGQFDELYKEAGPGRVLVGKKITKFFDGWIDMFEVAARVSAFKVAKETAMGEAAREGKKGPDVEKDATVRGAAYAKNLANFEQVGQWGKALGAFYMFFRPSATGAVRAMDALMPAFMDAQQARIRQPDFVVAAALRKELEGKVTGAARAKLEAQLKDAEKALDRFDSTFAQRKQNAKIVSMALMGVGFVVYQMAKSAADDDDLGRNKVATDDMSRWTKFARFYIPGYEQPFQLPWGFGLGSFAAMGAQMAAMLGGNTRVGDSLANMLTITLDSFLPLPVSRISPAEKPLEFAIDSTLPSIVRPLVEYVMNVDALGRQIYNNRQSRYGDAYTGGDSVPEAYKVAAQYLAKATNGDLDISPNTLYFFANSYADGASRLMHNGMNIGLWLSGEKDFNPKTDTLILDSFIGTKSNFDAREWQRIENDLKEREKRINMFKDRPEQYANYLAAHPIDQMLVDMYNHDVNGYLKNLREEANNYRAMEGLSPKDRKQIVDSIVMQQNFEKYRLIELYKAMGVNP
jgi:cation transport regulator ChaC